MNDELKKVYLDADVDIILIETLEMSHPSFSQIWYLCKYNKDFEAQLEDTTPVTFIPWGFEITLAETSSKGQTNTKFVIDVTDKIAFEELLAFKQDPAIPITLKYRQYFNNDPLPQVEAIEILLMDVQFNYNKISGVGSRADIVNKHFPRARYDIHIMRGLKYI